MKSLLLGKIDYLSKEEGEKVGVLDILVWGELAKGVCWQYARK